MIQASAFVSARFVRLVVKAASLQRNFCALHLRIPILRCASMQYRPLVRWRDAFADTAPELTKRMLGWLRDFL